MKMSSVQDRNKGKLKLDIQSAKAKPFSDTSKCFLSPKYDVGAQKVSTPNSTHSPSLENPKNNKFFR